jgi:sigma-B regulation protein RsbU (phosphoserine phosphatase)
MGAASEGLRTALLQKIPLFSSLPQTALVALASRLVERSIPEGTVLFKEGEPGERFFIIEDGQIAILKAMDTIDERLIGVRTAGEFIGEMSLLNRDGRRTASARVLESTRLLEMTRREFDLLLEHEPAFAYEMLQVLSDRLKDAHDESIRDLKEKNRQLRKAYAELQAAQEQIIEKKVIEHELMQAREIQESILPSSLPKLGGFDLGARMLPARQVGGDLYDVIPMGKDRLALVIGDVSGKGMPAALFMALTLSLIRAETSHIASPERVVRRVNRHLLSGNSQGMFVTLLFGVLDGPTREFQFIRAGHEFPLIMGPDGGLRSPSEGEGQLIGLFPSPVLTMQSIQLAPGSTLLLYTDGVTEARDSKGNFFRLEDEENKAILRHPSSAQELCELLAGRLLVFQGDVPQADDITLLAVKSL